MEDKPQLRPETTAERWAKAGALISSAAPWIGGPIAQVVGGAATDLKVKRVTQFVSDVLDRVEALHSEATELFVKTEDFIDIFEKTSQSVANERDEMKRTLFANFILKNIAAPHIEYGARLKYLRLMEQLDTRHVALLKALAQDPSPAELNMSIGAPSRTIAGRAPQLRSDLAAVLHETNTMGITSLKPDHLNLNMTGSGAAQLYRNVTDLGNELMAFLMEE